MGHPRILCFQERYCCYSHETKRYCMPTNITFFEDIFLPFLHEVDYVQQVFPIIVVEP